MLSGVKIIPRDQLDTNSDVDSPGKDKRKSKSRKDRHKKKKKSYNDRYGDDGMKTKKKSRTKKWYSSGASSSSSSSEDGSESGSGEMEHHKGKTSRKKDNRERERRCETEKNKKEGKDTLDDCSDLDEKGVARTKMGLEWMLKPLSQLDNKVDNPLEETEVAEVHMPNPKELNPYFKDDGSGYPEDVSQTGAGAVQLPRTSVVGDGGASWRLKALKRAREQAAREGRKFDQVVEERWGSLGQLTASVASGTAAPARAHLHAIKDRKRGQTKKSATVEDDQIKGTDRVSIDRREYLQDVSLRRPKMKEPKAPDSLSWKRSKRIVSAEDAQLIAEATSSLNKFASDGSFMDAFRRNNENDAEDFIGSHTKFEEGRKSERLPSSTSFSSDGKNVLSANQLAAKVLQLRMKGKHEEAELLLKEAQTQAVDRDHGAKPNVPVTEKSVSRHVRRDIPRAQKEQEEDADMHLAQKIMQNKRYSMSGQADEEYDYDNSPSRKHKRKTGGSTDQNLTGKNYMSNRLTTQQERCPFCFENPTRPKHLIVSIAYFTYLMLPQWEPIVEGHCCILPKEHESATRSIGNDVWDEIRNFKKCLIMMFAEQDKDVVFLETVMGLAKQRRHCLVECIPVSRDMAKEAPLYFKKAIDEAEEEWSQHNAKKLIETSVKGLRASIPKDFPYFHVEFGLDRGFVHVIDDERNFKSNFGLNVIRGMLRLPEEDMYRRRKQDSVETQRRAVANFAKEWDLFDWTKQL